MDLFSTDLWRHESFALWTFSPHVWGLSFSEFYQFLQTSCHIVWFRFRFCQWRMRKAVTTGITWCRHVFKWMTIKENNYLINSLTTAITFAQAALAGLDRGSGAGVAGCITWPTPLLSPDPAGDCALSPLRPGRPVILTVLSWKKKNDMKDFVPFLHKNKNTWLHLSESTCCVLFLQINMWFTHRGKLAAKVLWY